MRFLIVDHYYQGVIDFIYGQDPALGAAPYAVQRARIDEAMFGQTAFQADALRELGHEASDCLVNVRPLQEAWAREHGVPLRGTTEWGWRKRRGWVPWPRRPDSRWMGQGLLAQVMATRPDVVLIESMDLLEPALVAAVASNTRLVVGQVATQLPAGRSFNAYGFVVSSIPGQVADFRGAGIAAEWLPLAFEPRLRAMIPEVPRDIAISFVGSFSDRYADRTQIVEAVAASSPLATWTADAALLDPSSPILPTIRGVAWGRGMFEVLARSRMTINTHGKIAGPSANNLRLYEATGMGALLVTDERANLGDLFDVGREVVTFRDAADCAAVVRYYADHPAEAESIAEAGQRRTLREHTWADRMARLVEMIHPRL